MEMLLLLVTTPYSVPPTVLAQSLHFYPPTAQAVVSGSTEQMTLSSSTK